MPATAEAEAYTKNPNLTEEAFADQIRGDIERQYDANQPTKKFKVKVEVEEVALECLCSADTR